MVFLSFALLAFSVQYYQYHNFENLSFSCFGELRGDLVPEHRSGTGTNKKQKKKAYKPYYKFCVRLMRGWEHCILAGGWPKVTDSHLPIATLSVRSQCNCASHLPTTSLCLLCAVVAVSTVNSNVLYCCVCWSQLSVAYLIKSFFCQTVMWYKSVMEPTPTYIKTKCAVLWVSKEKARYKDFGS